MCECVPCDADGGWGGGGGGGGGGSVSGRKKSKSQISSHTHNPTTKSYYKGSSAAGSARFSIYLSISSGDGLLQIAVKSKSLTAYVRGT